MTERVVTDSNGRKYIMTEPFKPQNNTEAVLVGEMQRMAKRIDELEAELQDSFKMGYDAGVLETQLDQALERNFCHRCGTRLMSALGPISIHTCTPPHARTFDDYGNKIV